MDTVNRDKYLQSILFVFIFGALANVAIDQQIWRNWGSLQVFLIWMHNLKPNATGVSQVWRLLAGGGALAAVYVWVFETFLWKTPFLQGWFVLSPNLQGTWVGVIVPRTAAMQPKNENNSEATHTPAASKSSTQSPIPKWAIDKKVLPIHVTIVQRFNGMVFTGAHPNSRNTTLAQQIVPPNRGGSAFLYVVYFNEPVDYEAPNAAPHNGCYELKLVNDEQTKSATDSWRLTGHYWTNKSRSMSAPDDKGTWGHIRIRWESRKVGEKEIDYSNQSRFDV
jgi:hypothetical protein